MCITLAIFMVLINLNNQNNNKVHIKSKWLTYSAKYHTLYFNHLRLLCGTVVQTSIFKHGKIFSSKHQLSNYIFAFKTRLSQRLSDLVGHLDLKLGRFAGPNDYLQFRKLSIISRSFKQHPFFNISFLIKCQLAIRNLTITLYNNTKLLLCAKSGRGP